MIDIPRNELLDKLAAGWKCRRKGWPNCEHAIGLPPTFNSGRVSWWDLLKNDWEGEPPRPVKLLAGALITDAIKLRDRSSEKAFVRRADWAEHRRICENVLALVKSDILAKDWEVWE